VPAGRLTGSGYAARSIFQDLIGDVIRLEDVPEAIAAIVKNGSPQGKRHVIRFEYLIETLGTAAFDQERAGAPRNQSMSMQP
jgi:sulfite reductase beta subunit-like hemoprotein